MAKLNFTKDWFSNNIPSFEKHLLGRKNLRILEIGSFEGRSTLWMLQNLKPKRMVCVDPEKERNKILKQNLNGYNYELIESYNNYAFKYYIFNKFDFVYIDGSHKSFDCLLDLIIGWFILDKGGILAVDDYDWKEFEDGSRPKEAVDYFINSCNPKILELNYQAWFKKE